MSYTMRVEETDQRSWHFKQLRWSLQGLAASASAQKPLFPDAGVTPDELALDFDRRVAVIRETYGHDLTDVQRSSLEAIDQTLARMSRDGAEFDAELWTDAALTASEHWASVRRLAVAALDAFGWPADNPQPDSADEGARSAGEMAP
jgi:hypothetical protein